MTAVSPGVLILLGAAALVAVVFALAAAGILDLSMQGPPTRSGRRARAGKRDREQSCDASSTEPEIMVASDPLDGPR